MKEEVRLKSRHFEIKNDHVPVEAICELADKALDSGDNKKISEALADIHKYTASLGRGDVYVHKPKASLTKSSCIEYINENTISDYLNALIGFTACSLVEQDRSAISVLEEHFKHLHSIWMVKAFKRQDDNYGAEMLMVFLSDAIGMLCGYHGMGRSETVVACRHQAENKCIVWN
ncbi:unnamed protein product, partial [marine sediment metagenome]